jgi:hypothetical protein
VRSCGTVGPEWTVAGFGDFSGNANETDMLLRNSSTAAFEIYDISHNTVTSMVPMGAVGLERTVAGIAAAPPAGHSAAPTAQFAQALASFDVSAAVTSAPGRRPRRRWHVAANVSGDTALDVRSAWLQPISSNGVLAGNLGPKRLHDGHSAGQPHQSQHRKRHSWQLRSPIRSGATPGSQVLACAASPLLSQLARHQNAMVTAASVPPADLNRPAAANASVADRHEDAGGGCYRAAGGFSTPPPRPSALVFGGGAAWFDTSVRPDCVAGYIGFELSCEK